MTCEEWCQQNGIGINTLVGIETVRDAWDAATYAMNQEQGIAANEAEKDARRKAAMENIKHLIEDFYGNAWTGADEIEAFIKEAQG